MPESSNCNTASIAFGVLAMPWAHWRRSCGGVVQHPGLGKTVCFVCVCICLVFVYVMFLLLTICFCLCFMYCSKFLLLCLSFGSNKSILNNLQSENNPTHPKKVLTIRRKVLAFQRNLNIPKESLRIPKESLNIPKKSEFDKIEIAEKIPISQLKK